MLTHVLTPGRNAVHTKITVLTPKMLVSTPATIPELGVSIDVEPATLTTYIIPDGENI